MSNWKRKGSSQKTAKSRKWVQPVLTVFFLIMTVVGAVFNFPSYWNQGVDWASAQTHQDLSKIHVADVPYRLGLDLQGGTHLVYTADMSQIDPSQRATALEGVRDVIERRVNAFGVSEPVVQTTSTGGNYQIIVELAGVLDVKSAIDQIGETPILEFKEQNTDLSGQSATTDQQAQLDAANTKEKADADQTLKDAKAAADFSTFMTDHGGQDIAAATASNPDYADLVKAITDGKVRAGTFVPTVVQSGGGLYIVKYVAQAQSKRMELSHILICFEGKQGCTNPISALDANIQVTNLKKTLTVDNFADMAKQYSTDAATKDSGGYLGWVEPGQTVPAFELAAMQTPVGGISDTVETDFGYHIIYKKAEQPVTAYHLQVIKMPFTTLADITQPDQQWKNTGLSGKNLKSAAVEFSQSSGNPYVSLQFDSDGAKLFADLTSANVGKPIAIFLDGSAISTPVVNEAIYGGQAIIQGSFTLQEAKLLAQRLNAGALPVPISLISQQTVGPTLGQVSLNKSVMAALAGFALVALFMLLVYRLPGLIAIFALVLYAMLNLGSYKIFGVTISLSGIAGLVLSMGMAVDANVLIFERFKEELRSGRDMRSAMDEGFLRAWPSIRDGNMTTLIAAAVLYGFSSSFIKGFALTLSIGVILSMFSAIMVTRSYLRTAYLLPFLRWTGLYASKVKKNDA